MKSAAAPYWCVMPDSKWAGKNWPVEHFVELIKIRGIRVCVLGRSTDAASRRLCDLLRREGLEFVDKVGEYNYSELAEVVAGSMGMLSGDTGFAHLAEALGVPSRVIYGPTDPDLGFGPWKKESRVLGAGRLKCQPCSTDGSICYRFWDPRACTRGYNAAMADKDWNRRN